MFGFLYKNTASFCFQFFNTPFSVDSFTREDESNTVLGVGVSIVLEGNGIDLIL